jgi:PIN domain nuclease of toxin-antitoxin system
MIVLDTHVLLWWAGGESDALSATALAAIKREQKKQGAILVSSISAWEIAMLVDRNRLALSMDVAAWITAVTRIENLRFVPVDNPIALDSVTLPGTFHPDPADRIIVATARKHAAPLLTRDKKIQDYAHVQTIW